MSNEKNNEEEWTPVPLGQQEWQTLVMSGETPLLKAQREALERHLREQTLANQSLEKKEAPLLALLAALEKAVAPQSLIGGKESPPDGLSSAEKRLWLEGHFQGKEKLARTVRDILAIFCHDHTIALSVRGTEKDRERRVPWS